MHTVRIAIVGAGLSGLYAAYLLERQGITDYVLLEGREILGGRIGSIDAAGRPLPTLQPTPTLSTVSTWAPLGSGLATNASLTGSWRPWA